MKKTIILTAVITFLATSLLWFVILFFVGGNQGEEDLNLSIPTATETNSMSEMEASSNVTVYDNKGEWIGNGMLVETSSKAYLRMNNERYELKNSDVEGYRYIVAEEHLYVK